MTSKKAVFFCEAVPLERQTPKTYTGMIFPKRGSYIRSCPLHSFQGEPARIFDSRDSRSVPPCDANILSIDHLFSTLLTLTKFQLLCRRLRQSEFFGIFFPPRARFQGQELLKDHHYQVCLIGNA